MNRRQFLALSTLLVTSFKVAADDIPPGVSQGEHVIDAGPASDYSADGVYDHFAGKGFFVVRKGKNLFAMSSVCTHRKCKLKAETNRTFFCKCHGSTFDALGHVTEGPARKDLPVFSFSVSEQGRLLIKLPA